MLKVGVTGGIGSGKSTVCKIFESLGVPVFRSDEEGRRLLMEDLEVIAEVKKLFGESVIADGKPDRKKIAEIVFKNPEKLAFLNSIIHPAVRRKFGEWADKQNAPYVINEAAILFETGFYKQLDYMILVAAPEELRIKRVMQRDMVGMIHESSMQVEATIIARMKNQWSDDEKKKLADFTILNDEVTPLIPKVLEVHSSLLNLMPFRS